jgi:hypothetical protein
LTRIGALELVVGEVSNLTTFQVFSQSHQE